MDRTSTAEGASEIEQPAYAGTAPAAQGESDRATFFFSANTQFDNAGDALINRELLKVLRVHGSVRAARSGAPETFLGQLRLEEGELQYKGRRDLWLAACMEGLKAQFFGARHPFLVLTPGDPGGPLDIDVFVRGALMLALNLVGVRIVRLGVSLNRMSSGRLWLEAFLSRFYVHFGTRDMLSLSRAQNAGFRNVTYFPDFSLALSPAKRLHQRDHHVARIAVSLRDDNLDGDSRRALIAKLKQVLEAFSAGEHKISLHFVAQVGADADFMRELAACYGGPSGCMLTEEQNLGRLAELYSSTDIIISNRLHSLLFASANGAIPFGLLVPEKNKKIVALLRDLNLTRHWTSLDTGEDVPDLSWLYAREEAVKAAFQRSGHLIEKHANAIFGASTR
ncbi:polysaccharide pyruvyl transferase family protein [Rhizobium sullae]|uniref:Polysaccharide pyruvyl transferase n=1 Tax=Rhizobium sullae TaxID=50338 RepID=A0A4R3PRK9_RHISU|nr:polysaccharide pyruvyl transferase family protein [Rhizobium sullae]TCU06827.1 polysaccharide pyruvyl transferase [Rhizobium sullae]